MYQYFKRQLKTPTCFRSLYALFWVIPRCLKFICRHFGTLCLFQLHRQVWCYEDGTECSETSAYKFQTPGNHPKESIRHSVHGESLKSRCFRSFGIHPEGVLNVLHWKLLVMFCVRSQCSAAWNLDTTCPNFTLPNTDYAHKTSQVIFSEARLILPEDGSQRIRNMLEFLIVF